MTNKEKLLDIVLNKLNDTQFWNWVSSWYNTDAIVDIITNWEEDVVTESDVEEATKLLDSQNVDIKNVALDYAISISKNKTYQKYLIDAFIEGYNYKQLNK